MGEESQAGVQRGIFGDGEMHASQSGQVCEEGVVGMKLSESRASGLNANLESEAVTVMA